MRLHVPEMTCGHCVNVLRAAFDRAMPGVAIEIDLALREVRGADGDADRIAEVVRSAGYEGHVVG